MGFSVLLIDYRGYGLSDGAFPSESTVYADAEAAWGYLIQEQSFRPKDIVIYGHSLGGAVGIQLTLQHPDAAGLIVESTFTSILDVAKSRRIYRIFPLRWIVNQKFDSIGKISRLRTPVLFIHGVKDEAIPTYMSQQLYDITTAPKRLLLVPDGTHNNNAGIDELRYLRAVADFLEYAMDTPSVDARCCQIELGKA
jgi:pimeloyl-ACP methyl ester carboxylesterase